MERNDRTLQLFTILAAFIEERLGMRYSWEDSSLLFDKLEDRVLEAGQGSLLQYYYKLRYDDPKGEELKELASTLSVGETYLFREADALFFLADHVIPKVIAERGRARLWCAASSTGEELFSLALLLQERGTLERVSLVGTDLSHRSIERARTGSLSVRSLERSPQRQLAEPYLEHRDGRLYLVRDLAERISFEVLNLVDDNAVRAQPMADVILLRNVLIYFSPETVQRVVALLLDRLRDDGVLLLGVSESLMRQDLPLECHEHGGVFFYSKARQP